MNYHEQKFEWLKPRMDQLFERKAKLEAKGTSCNEEIQKGREYRNPRICDVLIERFDIKEYGTNFPKEVHNPSFWKSKPDYRSSEFTKLHDRRERERVRNPPTPSKSNGRPSDHGRTSESAVSAKISWIPKAEPSHRSTSHSSSSSSKIRK